MSVDLSATMPKPITVGALLAEASLVLSKMVGSAPVQMVAFTGREWRDGEMIGGGSIADPEELVGSFGRPPGRADRPPVQFFDLGIEGLGDQARLMAVDYRAPERGHEGVSLTVSPYRTPLGVVAATATALAAATLSRGEFVDLNIGFVLPPVADPREFIERTKLPPSSEDVAAACLQWIRQFAHLNGWPPE